MYGNKRTRQSQHHVLPEVCVVATLLPFKFATNAPFVMSAAGSEGESAEGGTSSAAQPASEAGAKRDEGRVRLEVV